MEYCFQLYPFANIKYREALKRLGRIELLCILRSIGIETEVTEEQLSGSAFLSFRTDEELSQFQLDCLARHSALLMFCSRENGLLRPLNVSDRAYLGEDLPEILKYKGKTAVPFTNMLITLAWCASDYFLADRPVTVLDPICGRGTSLFCALQRGMNAVGVDTDAADVQEADRYLEKYLKTGRYKHIRKETSRTIKGKGLPEVSYQLADTKEHYLAGDTRRLTLTVADTGLTGELMKKQKAHLLVADLPYGVQHAPMAGRKPESFDHLLARCLPAWRDALENGGAMAVSFNKLTIKRNQIIDHMKKAGLVPAEEFPWDDFSHPVEQAVERDLVVARKE